MREWFRSTSHSVLTTPKTQRFSGFIGACPGGALDKEGIMSMYLMPRHQAQIFIDEMFGMFDVDGNGTVSFQVSQTRLHRSLYDLEDIFCLPRVSE